MPARSTARAEWIGALLTGNGTVTTGSSALADTPITWRARIGETAGTTPEELLASAHASCYSMAFAGSLANAGHEPEQLDAHATYEFGPLGEGGFAIQAVTLTVRGVVPGIDEAEFLELADGAKAGCPVSKALSQDLSITLDAQLLPAT